jgi:hypothetical protein
MTSGEPDWANYHGNQNALQMRCEQCALVTAYWPKVDGTGGKYATRVHPKDVELALVGMQELNLLPTLKDVKSAIEASEKQRKATNAQLHATQQTDKAERATRKVQQLAAGRATRASGSVPSSSHGNGGGAAASSGTGPTGLPPLVIVDPATSTTASEVSAAVSRVLEGTYDNEDERFAQLQVLQAQSNAAVRSRSSNEARGLMLEDGSPRTFSIQTPAVSPRGQPPP